MKKKTFGVIFVMMALIFSICFGLNSFGRSEVYAAPSHNHDGITAKNAYYEDGNHLILDGELEEGASIDIGMEVDGSGNFNLRSIDDFCAVVTGTDFTKGYMTFSDALTDWTDGRTLELLKDVSGTQITVSSGTKTLDLNNHVISYTSGSVVEVSGGKLFIQDSNTNKTRHYYNTNQAGEASITDTTTDNYFDGGYITGCNVLGIGGGGLRITGGEVVLSSGTIFGNRGGTGGGVKIAPDCKMTIEGTGGVIGNYGGGEYTSGGGISCDGILIMTGGYVKHNTAYLGVGGIRVTNANANTSFTMTGGEVSGNYGRTWLAGGIHVDGSSVVKIGGSAKIFDNYYLSTQKNLGFNSTNKLVIIEPFTEDAIIRIFPCLDKDDNNQGKATLTNPIVFTTNWDEIMGDANPYSYFICDPIYKRNGTDLITNYKVYNKNGNAAVGPVTYTITYNGNGSIGGEVPVDENEYISGSEVEVLDNLNDLTKPLSAFAGWNTKADGTGTTYAAGAKFNIKDDITLYAVWKHSHDEIIFNPWTSSTSLPTSGSYYLTCDVTISTTCNVSGTLNLCLNGYGIRFTGTNISSGSVFFVDNGKTFNLYDCGETEHKFTVDVKDPNGSISYIDSDKIKATAGLATVNDNLTENYETFTGGYITGGIGSLYSSDSYYGGAVRIYGGTFNMYGGTIIGNTTKGTSSSSNRGGAVAVQGGSFTMNGGCIMGNTIPEPESYSGTKMGGGVFVSSSYISSISTNKNGYFTMNGGTIERNLCKNGGGIFVGTSVGANEAVVNMNGGIVKENHGYDMCGGMYIQGGTVNISNTLFTDNISSTGAGIGAFPSVYSSATKYATLNIIDCIFKGNVGTSGGAALYVSGEVYNAKIIAAVINITGTQFIENYTQSANIITFTGKSNVDGLDAYEAYMTDCIVKDNINYHGYYGGLILSNSNTSSAKHGPKLTITDCEIVDNFAQSSSDYGINNGAGLVKGQMTTLNIGGRIIINNNKFYQTYQEKYYDSNLFINQTTTTDVTFNIIESLTEDSIIGVRKYRQNSSTPTVLGVGQVTSGLEGHGSMDNFYSSGYEYYLTEVNGEIFLNEKAKVIYNRNGINYGVLPNTGYFIPGVEKAVVADCGTLSKNGYAFMGWNTKADGTGILYKTGDEFDITENVNLYAIFEHGTHDDIDFVLWTSTDSLPTEAGNYALGGNVTITESWVAPAGVTNLCLNGRGITMTGQGSVIIVNDGAKLIIHNCNTDSYDANAKHFVTYPANSYGKATVNNTSGSNYFYNGYIAGGNATYGGAINISDGGDVTLLGGWIIGNTANYGGAVYLAGSSAILRIGGNAQIINNETNGYNGGGVYIASGAQFIMEGGAISKNYAAGNGGGGVQIDDGTFLFKSGYIINNASNGNKGAGIYVGDGYLEMEGNPYVYNNVDASNNKAKNNIYVSDNTHFSIVGEIITNNSSIGISMATPGAFTNTAEENAIYNKDSSFFSDNSNYIIVNDGSQLLLIPSNAKAIVVTDSSTSYYSDISIAINEWTDGSTLKLVNDISGITINVNSGTKTLDLNNHSIVNSNARVLNVSNGATLYIQDTSAAKTKHYYTPNTTGVATISGSTTSYYFEGGYISGGSNDRGGAIRADDSTIYFTSGTIFGSKGSWGGAIYVYNTQLTISDTAAIIGCYSNGNYTSGGAIFSEGNKDLIMTGGSIRHNSAQYSGGGIRVSQKVADGAFFIMTGGEITGNYSGNNQGSGVGLDQTNTIMLGGSARIYGNTGTNLYLRNSDIIEVVEAFTSEALIYVTTQTLPTEEDKIVITTGWKNIMGDVKNTGTFVFDVEGYRIIKNSDGELIAKTPHIHKWEYTVDGNVITATCLDDCPIETLTLTLEENDKEYDGTSVEAIITKDEEWKAANGLIEPGDVVYSSTSPNAGTYTASLTIGTVTATQEYTITKKALTITTDNKTITYGDAVPSYTVSYDGFVTGDNKNNLTGTLSFNCSYQQFDDARDYEITASGYTSDNYDITFVKGKLTVNQKELTLNWSNTTFDYDGENHLPTLEFTGNVNNDELGITVIGEESDAGTYTATASAITGTKAANYKLPTLNTKEFTINPIDITVTITGSNDITDYDGTEHTVTGYEAEASSDLYDVDLDFTFSGTDEAKRTNAGTTNMGLTASMFVNTNPNFGTVTFNVTDGYQTINQIDAEVTITGNNSTLDYDGTEHTVTSYVAVADTNLYNVDEDFTFSGTAEAKRTNVGTTNMGLQASMFANTNANFANVTFIIVDGYQTINPINVTVTITGNSSEVNYDGIEHKVTGYVALTTSDLYNVNADFTFSGTAEVTRQFAGTSYMGLTEDMFENINDNFIVTFEVIDGYQTINLISATVYITGNSGSFEYDGQEHTVSGYVATTDSELYNLDEDFKFIGDSELVLKDVGTKSMKLYSFMFVNINSNFYSVTFIVKNGTITITPIDAEVTIIGNNDTASYDGEEHTITGYTATTESSLYDVTKDIKFTGEAIAKQTVVGKTNMGLTSAMFENTNPNFANVTFNIIDGYQEVTQIDVEVTITGATNTVAYDGTEHTVTGYEAVANTDLYDVEAGFTFTGKALAKQTNVGKAFMGLTAEMFENTNANFANVTFIIVDGYQEVEAATTKVTITGNNNTATYDGVEHSASGYIATAESSLYNINEDFTFTGKALAKQTNVGKANMGLTAEMFENTNANFNVTFEVVDGYQEITAADLKVTITGNNNVAVYNGEEHTITGYAATTESILYDVEADFTFTGSAEAKQTAVGKAFMDLTADMFENTNPNFNVTFEVVDGYQAVVAYDITVTITGNNSTLAYDGKEHKVEGYVATADSNLYNVEADFTFTGEALAKQTDAGTTEMNLAASMFTNNNEYFNVTFVVIDGYITINQINATVTITGNNNTTPYDGEEHEVSGYIAEANTNLYNVEEDFTFTGEALAKQIDAGTTEMNLAASMFENTNPNFKTVTFVVVDGYQKVTPIDAEVTITGNSNTAEYDGKEHKVTGYEAVANTNLYNVEADIIFAGTAEAKQTVVGKTNMNLASSMFANKNANFKIVTFIVVDGYQEVTPVDVTVTITGNNNTTPYDGKEHEVAGYVATTESNLYNLESDFTFTGTAGAKQTAAGKANMGLTASMFENTNDNFKTVTFVIVDGYQEITPVDVTVTITGNNNTNPFDGEEHIVSGYVATTESNLYNIEVDFTFTGTAEVKQTDAGKANMGLVATMFNNTNANFNVKFVVVDGYQEITPIDVEVTITGNNNTSLYDGEEHIVTGYVATADSDLYNVEADFTFTGNALAKRSDAGITSMSLLASMFNNTNANFKVKFKIVDGYQKITPIDVTVTITGNASEASYDGEEHVVSGYVATADSNLYNVEADFTFIGTAEAKRTNAGKTNMGLQAIMFINKNKNFANVTFNVVDGNLTINPTNPTITVLPKALELTYNGENQELISAGQALGGTILYALGSEDASSVNDSMFKAEIPTALEANIYYVWYMVLGDENHNDLAQAMVKVVIAEDEWGNLHGVIYQHDGQTPIEGATVKVYDGNQEIDHIITEADGKYRFTIPNGVYNIVVEYDDVTMTQLVELYEENEKDVKMPDGNTKSVVEVKTEGEEHLGVAVGGLDDEAYLIREAEGVADDVNVSVLMTVETKSEETAKHAEAIVEAAEEKNFDFFEIKVEKTVNDVTTQIDETHNVLEIAIQYKVKGRREIVVYSYHDTQVRTFVESDTKANGTFRVDTENNIVYVYTNSFSTYAIAYTPYYNIKGSLELGSYDGTTTIELINQETGKTYRFDNISVGQIKFGDVPKGTYTVNVIWNDKATNTISLTLTIGEENKTKAEDTTLNNEVVETETELLSEDQLDDITSILSTSKLKELMQQYKEQLNNLIRRELTENKANKVINKNIADLENGFTNKHDNHVAFGDGYNKKKKEK